MISHNSRYVVNFSDYFIRAEVSAALSKTRTAISLRT